MTENSSSADDRLRRKQDFYTGLEEALKSEDDEVQDPGRDASKQALQKGVQRQQSARLRNEENANGLPRSLSDTNLVKKTTDAPHVSEAEAARPATSHGATLPPSLASRHTFAGATANTKHTKPSTAAIPTSSKTTSKRKRGLTVKPVPVEQQIFKDLIFYFFPNTDTHPARKMRIAKAKEFGATWQKDFDDSVTHVIVDKMLDYSLLLKFIKKDSLDLVVVSEEWPAECVAYRTLLDPNQLQFKVKGKDLVPAAKPTSSESEKSLQLKKAGKSVQARRPETPSADKRSATPPPAVPSDDDDNSDEAAPPPPINPRQAVSDKVQSTEEFDIAIRKAKELQHVPLDNEDDPVSRPSSSEGPSTSDDDQPQQDKGEVTFLKKKKNKMQRIQDSFQCMQKHTGAGTPNPNAETIAILQQMAEYYGQIGDEWRIRAYRKAIATLRNHPTKIWTRDEAVILPQIGDRLATKIEEIAYTNRLRRLDSARADPSDQILQTFMQVYGAGFAQASKWVAAGFTNLDEILQKADDLTANQRIGITHYEDFNSRIPRAEVEQHGRIVRQALQKIDPAFEVIVGGSYRRGSETSGDVDCIITARPGVEMEGAYIRQVVLDQLVPALFAKGFLVAELAATSREEGSKWHGACSLPSPSPPTTSPQAPSMPWRRIDLLLVPSAEIGAALIYFTGNDIFNRSLRLLASTKGMRLNQRGLYRDVLRGKGRVKLSEGVLVEGRDERRIFEGLGVPWRPPEHRIC